MCHMFLIISGDDHSPITDDQTSSNKPIPTPESIEPLYYNVCPPQSAGKVFSSNTELFNSVLVVNGLSSLGARIAHTLGSNTQWEVFSISSTRDRLCGDKLMWYRQDMLRESAIPNSFVDLSDSKEVELLLKVHFPSHVIFVPPSIDGGYTLNSTMWSAALHDFVALLEAVKTISPASRLTLVSVSKSVKNELQFVQPNGAHMSLLETLVGAFELSLSTYHTLYHIPFTVLRLKKFYGPWTHSGLNATLAGATHKDTPVGCYIDDIVRAVHSSLSLHSKCTVLDFGSCEHDATKLYALEKLGMRKLTSANDGRKLTKEWRSAYNSKKNRNLILTSYFTSNGFHHSAAVNRFKVLQSWLESVNSQRLHAVILHDGLDSEFITRARDQYPRLSFESVSLPYKFGKNSTCTQSVKEFANYLEYTTGIDRVVIMDVRKIVKRNVFPTMKALGDWLYSDVDIVLFRDIVSPAITQDDSTTAASSMVLGGSRHLVLAALNRMAQCLENGSGIAALQCTMDLQFIQHSFMGWPLSVAIGG